jgi:hypothetical protein
MTNSEYDLEFAAELKKPFFGKVKSSSAIKIGASAMIDFENNIYHVVLFMEEIDEFNLYCISGVLEKFVDNEAFEGVKLNIQDLTEGGRFMKSDAFQFTAKVFLETRKSKIPKEKAYEILNSLEAKYKGKEISFGLRDDNDWAKLDQNNKKTLFICHDHKDKDVAEELYFELQKRFISTWFDKYSLKLGDSLIHKMNEGLNNCDYGLVLLSKNMLSNEKWADYELTSLINKQVQNRSKLILPVWLGITPDDLSKHSWLGNLNAADLNDGVESVCDKIETVLYDSDQ